MNLAQSYAALPGVLRHGVNNAAQALPAFQSRANPLAKAKRFVAAASLSPIERYLRWISAFDEPAKLNLYSDSFRHETAKFSTAGIIAPWFAKANGSGIVDAALFD